MSGEFKPPAKSMRWSGSLAHPLAVPAEGGEVPSNDASRPPKSPKSVPLTCPSEHRSPYPPWLLHIGHVYPSHSPETHWRAPGNRTRNPRIKSPLPRNLPRRDIQPASALRFARLLPRDQPGEYRRRKTPPRQLPRVGDMPSCPTPCPADVQTPKTVPIRALCCGLGPGAGEDRAAPVVGLQSQSSPDSRTAA